jgi:hypothetical protein
MEEGVTFEALAPWLALLVVVGILWAIGTKQRRPGHVRRRSEAHEAYLAFLTEILREPEVRTLMFERGTTNAARLTAFQETMGELTEPFLRACAAKLFEDRLVRRLVAKVVAANHGDMGADKRKVMREMGGLVEEVRP